MILQCKHGIILSSSILTKDLDIDWIPLMNKIQGLRYGIVDEVKHDEVYDQDRRVREVCSWIAMAMRE